MDSPRKRTAARIVRRLLQTIVVIVVALSSGIVPVSEISADVFNRPTTSSSIAISSNNALVWVVNPDDDSVSVIRTSDNTPIAKIAVGNEPRSVALDPNNVFAYVANAASNTVSVIRIINANPASFQAALETVVGQNGSLATGAEPWDIVISPNGNRVFVANSGQDTITVINALNRTVLGTVDLRNSVCNDPDRTRHFQPRGMAVNLTNSELYVTRFLSFTKSGGRQGTDTGREGSICRLNIDTVPTTITAIQPAARITLPAQVTGFQIDANGDTVLDDTSAFPNQLQSVVIRGNRAYLPNIAASPSGPLRFNVDTHAFVNQVDGVNSPGGIQISAGAINLHLGARTPEAGKKRLFFANPWAIAFSSQTGSGSAYVVSAGSDLLVKLNVDNAGNLSNTVNATTTRYIDLHDPDNPATSGLNAAKNPQGIAINDAGTRAYVMNFVSRNVSVVDLTTDSVLQVVKTTNLPVAGSADEIRLVGAEMFFASRGVFNRPGGTTASTTDRLSSEGWQACASCHFNGLTDSVVWEFGAGPRKSVSLNGSFNPNDPDDQRILNYSGIFDEVQDFEANIRNVSGPGALTVPINGTTNDPNHGLLIGDDGNINNAPNTVNAFALANAGADPEHTVSLPGSAIQVPALDALKEWVRFNVRTPNGRLTSSELTAGAGDPTFGLNPADVLAGRTLFFTAGCDSCHGGGKWTNSKKDFVSPPAAGEIFTERTGTFTGNPVGTQYLNRFLRDIGSFNLGVPGAGNNIGNNVGAAEKATGGQDGLGIDYNNDTRGIGFNIPSLLASMLTPPYYHNGSCESLACVLTNVRHRTANNTRPDVLTDSNDRARLVAFLETIDAQTSTVAVSCSPRPPVGLASTRAVAGQFNTTVTATGTGNAVQEIQFISATNAQILVGGVAQAPNAKITLPANTPTFTFTFKRIAAAQAATVRFYAIDACGTWPTFVGLGTGVQ